jgi:arylsulfatase A-like enzyme
MPDRKRLTQTVSLILILALVTTCSLDELETNLGTQLPRKSDLNVLVISFDALRADALGVYGYQRSTTPNIDLFSKRALVFDRAYSAAPVTPTSFAAAFTGLFPFRVFHSWKLDDAQTIAGVFSEAGWYTFALLNNTQLVAERNFQQGFDRYDVIHGPDEDILSGAVSRLTDSEQPFFGWVHFLSPHSPYDKRAIASHLYDPNYSGRFEETTGGPTFNVANAAELKRVRDLYDGEIYYVDHLFGKLMSSIEELGLLKDTLIVVTADHGEEFMEHGQLQHNAQYEQLIRIPLMIYHPSVGLAARTDAPYSNVDLLPTLAAIVDINLAERTDGIDVVRNFRASRPLISTGMTGGKRRQISVNRGRDKLITTCKPDYQKELFDLVNDKAESEDRISDDPGLAMELFEILKAATYGDPCLAIENAIAGREPETGLTLDQIEQLKSLGYLQ